MGHQPKNRVARRFPFAFLSRAVIWSCFFASVFGGIYGIGCNGESGPQRHPPTTNQWVVPAKPILQSITITSPQRSTTQSKATVIAIHGLGDTPQNLSQIFDTATFNARIVLPQAPALHGAGYSWFPIAKPVRKTAAAILQKDVHRATEQICQFIRTSRFPQNPVITGFSQGGILSFSVAVTCPELIAASFPVSGFLPFPVPASSAPIPPIEALHGTRDEIIDFEKGKNSILRLKKSGAHATLHEFPNIGHQLSMEMNDDLLELIERYL